MLDAEMALWFNGSILVAVALIALFGTVSWLTICMTMAPVKRLRDALARRKRVDMRPVPSAELPQELRPLVDGFNTVMGQLDTALRAERHFLADAAHKMRTPLAVLTAQARLVLIGRQHARGKPRGHRAAGGRHRAGLPPPEQLLGSARLDATTDAPAHTAAALHEVVSLVVRDFAAMARQQRRRLLLDTEPCAPGRRQQRRHAAARPDRQRPPLRRQARIQVRWPPRAGERRWCVALGVRDGPGRVAPNASASSTLPYRVPGTAGPRRRRPVARGAHRRAARGAHRRGRRPRRAGLRHPRWCS